MLAEPPMSKGANVTHFSSRFCLFGLLLTVLFWLQCAHAIDVLTHDHPDVQCPPEDNTIAIACPYNGYIVNPNPVKCRDRYVCYAGPRERCDDDRPCGRGLECICNICQNCVGTRCHNELCPQYENNLLKRWIKRYGRNLLEYGM